MKAKLFLTLVLASLAASLAIEPAFAATAKPTQLKLALNWKPEPEFGGFYQAREAGEFSKRNLDVQVMEGGAGTPVVQMLAAGKVEYGIVEADEIILSQEHGSDVVALFAVYQTSPMGIMVRATRGAGSLKEVMESEGTLAIQPGSNYQLFLKQKYPNSKVKQVPYLGGVGNFLEDPKFAQQCFVTSEPLVAKKKGVEAKTFLIASEGFNPYVTVLATRAERIKSHPAEVKAMVDAVAAGWQGYLKDPKATNGVMAKLNTSMDAETFAEIAETQKPLIGDGANVGKMNEERWTQLIQQLKELKVAKGSARASKLFHK